MQDAQSSRTPEGARLTAAAFRWAVELQASHYAQSFAIGLVYYADKKTLLSAPSVGQVARRMAMSLRTARAAVGELETAGFITVYANEGYANTYRLNLGRTRL